MAFIHTHAQLYFKVKSEHAKIMHWLERSCYINWTYCSERNPVVHRLLLHLRWTRNHHTRYPILHCYIPPHDLRWQRTLYQPTWGLQ